MDASDVMVTLHGLDPGFREICDALYPGLEPREVADAVYGNPVAKKLPSAVRAGGGGIYGQSRRVIRDSGRLAGKVKHAAGQMATPNGPSPYAFEHYKTLGQRGRVANRQWLAKQPPGPVIKSEPASADVHVPTTQWRNGRGNTKGRGRRKIDNTVLSTRFVAKNEDLAKLFGQPKKQTGQSANTGGLARGIGLGTTAVGTGISAVSLPKHLREIPSAMKNAKTGPNVGSGIKSAVKTVRSFAKPNVITDLPKTESAVKTGVGALKAGVGVARDNPRISAGLLLGATALHTANLAGEAVATHVLHNQKQPAVPKSPAIHMAKAWDQAQALIIDAHRQGLVSKSEALDLAKAVLSDLAKQDFGSTAMQAPTKLVMLKAPPPVTLDQPKLPATQTQIPKPAKSGAGRKAGGSTQKKNVKKVDDVPEPVAADVPEIEFGGEISKLNEDKQQCFGWCSVVKINGRDHIDKQNDLIDIDDIEEAAYDYVLHSRKGGDMHQRSDDGGVLAKAEMIESFVLTPEKIAKMGLPDTVPQGWWIGMQVHDPDLWSDVKTGRKRKFSIHGTGIRQEVLVDD